ncbi:PrgI family protein [Eubacterium pyruvativorans]|uniref:PrgI family protein n=1 Tax=Eubacterium pyruvativorans TaxID=155865 RepID=UPI00088CF15F|nr:PrgI family protein [Eubacterium pyruvativorans]SDF49039.1 PrgI family protein [Eubacterium pyruvativorans]
MEVRINREIREYTESMFFGLTLRQFIFSVLACAIAVLIYFTFKPVLGLETVSWICIVAAAPFAAIGFLRYNGMTAEKFIAAWIRSEILLPEHLCFGNTNLYYNMFRESAEESRKKKFPLRRRGGRAAREGQDSRKRGRKTKSGR